MKRNDPSTSRQPASARARAGIAAGIIVLPVLVGGVFLLKRQEPVAETPARTEPLANSTIVPRTSPPDPADSGLRRPVSEVLGYTGDLPTEARIRELMDTRDELDESEVAELLRGLLSFPDGSEAIAARSTWFHELANLLQRQDVDRRSFSEVLATVARDGRRDLATRDYALQQLRELWAKASSDTDLRGAIESTFVEMSEAGNPLRPSALLSLHLVDPAGKTIDTGALSDMTLSILRDRAATGDVALHCRMVAARIAGERRIEGSREPLLAIATDESAHALARMAAVSALGQFADPSVLETLRAFSPSDARVAVAIRHAVPTAPSR